MAAFQKAKLEASLRFLNALALLFQEAKEFSKLKTHGNMTKMAEKLRKHLAAKEVLYVIRPKKTNVAGLSYPYEVRPLLLYIMKMIQDAEDEIAVLEGGYPDDTE